MNKYLTAVALLVAAVLIFGAYRMQSRATPTYNPALAVPALNKQKARENAARKVPPTRTVVPRPADGVYRGTLLGIDIQFVYPNDWHEIDTTSGTEKEGSSVSFSNADDTCSVHFERQEKGVEWPDPELISASEVQIGARTMQKFTYTHAVSLRMDPDSNLEFVLTGSLAAPCVDAFEEMATSIKKPESFIFYGYSSGDLWAVFEGGPVPKGKQGDVVPDYKINFGDGSVDTVKYLWQSCPASGECIREPIDQFQTSHRYRDTGTYKVVLLKGGTIVSTTSVVVKADSLETGTPAGPVPGER